jgi:hypothetical protein
MMVSEPERPGFTNDLFCTGDQSAPRDYECEFERVVEHMTSRAAFFWTMNTRGEDRFCLPYQKEHN